MNLTRGLVDYLDALGTARLGLRAPSVFLPFAVFGAVQCALLGMLAFFTAGAIAPFMVPIVRWLGGPDALHYPMHLVQLPGIYQKVYLPLAATLGFACWTLGVWSMIDHHVVGRKRPKRVFLHALPHVLLAGIVFVGVSFGIGAAISALFQNVPASLARVGSLAGLVLVAGAQAFLVFTPVVLRLRGGNVWSAVRTSARYAARRLVPVSLVLITVLAIHAPVDYLLSQSHRVAVRFDPEVVFYLLVSAAVLEMFTAYLLFASVAAFALPEEGGMR